MLSTCAALAARHCYDFWLTAGSELAPLILASGRGGGALGALTVVLARSLPSLSHTVHPSPCVLEAPARKLTCAGEATPDGR